MPPNRSTCRERAPRALKARERRRLTTSAFPLAPRRRTSLRIASGAPRLQTASASPTRWRRRLVTRLLCRHGTRAPSTGRKTNAIVRRPGGRRGVGSLQTCLLGDHDLACETDPHRSVVCSLIRRAVGASISCSAGSRGSEAIPRRGRAPSPPRVFGVPVAHFFGELTNDQSTDELHDLAVMWMRSPRRQGRPGSGARPSRAPDHGPSAGRCLTRCWPRSRRRPRRRS